MAASSPPRIFYRPPVSSKDTRHIWDESGLPEAADEISIKFALDSWATWHAYVYKKDQDEEFYIQWVNPNGYIIKTIYDTFVRWILVSCAAPPAPTQPINLTN
jgi:hypothetical protein